MTRTARTVVVGDDGKTRFEEIQVKFHHLEGVVPGGAFDAAPLGTNDVAILRFAPGYDADFHHSPTPTWMMIMTGRIHLGVSDDVWVELVPGDIVYMTDSTGEGHRTRVLGDEEVLMATAGFGG
jgi:hypothetical protein